MAYYASDLMGCATSSCLLHLRPDFLAVVTCPCAMATLVCWSLKIDITIPHSSSGEVAQWIANRKNSSSSPALPTVLRVKDISNLSSHTVHSAECTGNCV